MHRRGRAATRRRDRSRGVVGARRRRLAGRSPRPRELDLRPYEWQPVLRARADRAHRRRRRIASAIGAARCPSRRAPPRQRPRRLHAKSALHRGSRRIPVRSRGHRRDDRPRPRTGRRRGSGWGSMPTCWFPTRREAGCDSRTRSWATRWRRSGTRRSSSDPRRRPHTRSPAAIPVTTTLRRLRPTQQPARLTIPRSLRWPQSVRRGSPLRTARTQRRLGIGRSPPR